LRGYSELTCKNRTTGQGGGVGLYFKNGLKYKIIEDKSLFFDHVLESICAEITLPSLKKIAVVSLYRPAAGHPTLSPVFQFDQFLELFSNLISSLLDSYSEVYLLGDFNINVLKYTSCEQAKEFIDLLFSFGLLQVVTKPTRCTPNSATLIDHVLSTPRSSFFETAIITNKISDHFPIIHFWTAPKIVLLIKRLSLEIFLQLIASDLKNFCMVFPGTVCVSAPMLRRRLASSTTLF
jgi:hypothetical protein